MLPPVPCLDGNHISWFSPVITDWNESLLNPDITYFQVMQNGNPVERKNWFPDIEPLFKLLSYENVPPYLKVVGCLFILLLFMHSFVWNSCLWWHLKAAIEFFFTCFYSISYLFFPVKEYVARSTGCFAECHYYFHSSLSCSERYHLELSWTVWSASSCWA